MRILFVTTAHNSLSQRLQVELVTTAATASRFTWRPAMRG